MARSSLVLLLGFALVVAAQNTPKPAGIQGVVLNALTGEPLPKAHVILSTTVKDAVRKYGAITDEKGHFSIQPIEPANYRTSVDLLGFLFAPQRAADNGRIDIAAEADMHDLKLKMMPQGVIAGRVVNADGDPVERVPVAAMRGARKVATHLTDAKGEFRISGLAAGKYQVLASPFGLEGPPEIRTDGSRERRNGATYFPGVSRQSEATYVEVHGGAEVGGTEIHLLASPVVKVSGTISGIPPNAGKVKVVRTTPPYGQDFPVTGGIFTFWGWPRDAVRVSAWTSAAGQNYSTAPVDIEIADTDIEHLDLALIPQFELKGRIEWEGSPPDVKKLTLRLQAVRSTYDPSLAEIDSEGTFRLQKMDADRYQVAIDRLPVDAYVKSQLLDLRNGAAGESLTIVISAAGARLSGIVRDADGPLLDVAVGVIEDRPGRFDTLRMTRTGADGSYAIHALPPGKYKLFLFDGNDYDSLVQTGLLGVYEAAAEKIELAERDQLKRDLRR